MKLTYIECSRNLQIAFAALPFTMLSMLFFGAPPQASAQIAKGTVMVSTGSGKVTEFTQAGTILGQLDTGTGALAETGSIFDSAGNFFVTDFGAQQVTKFDPTGALIGPFGGPYNVDPESIIFDAAGNVYVGQADGARTVLEFNSSGTLINTFAPATEYRGTDWIELAADQCTLFYTSEGDLVKRFNVCTNTQLADFNTTPLYLAYAHRLLPSGGMLVACTLAVIRLDASGNRIQTYTLPGTSLLFALNLDPDGTSFWTADSPSGQVFKVDIATGNILEQWSAAGAPGFVDVGGLSVKGEIIVSNPGKKCPLSQGFWKNHPGAWPVTSLNLGSHTYSEVELLIILGTRDRGDASLTLAKQLIAAKLNIDNHSNPAPVASTIADADSFLAGFTGKLPYNVSSSSATGQKMISDATVLDKYNNDLVTPNCKQ